MYKSKPKTRRTTKNSVSAFIAKTYEILEDGKFPDIVDWNFEGDAIVIKKPTEFAQTVLSIYFKHRNLTSFVRQLNMYNFHKQRTSKIEHVYSHELFQRGKKYLLPEIKRKNQEQLLTEVQETIEEPESIDPNQDIMSIIQEKQVLKRSNNHAIGKINCLEGKIKDLVIQNQALKDRIWQQDERDKVLISLMANILKKYGIPPSELSSMMKLDLEAKELSLAKSENTGSNFTPTFPSPLDMSMPVNEESKTIEFLNSESLSSQECNGTSTALNHKGKLQGSATSRDVSPSSFIGKIELDRAQSPLKYHGVSSRVKDREKESFLIPKHENSFQWNEKDTKLSKTKVIVKGCCREKTGSNLGKRKFEEQKADGIEDKDVFEIIMKKTELNPSSKMDDKHHIKNNRTENMWIKTNECSEEFTTDFLSFKGIF